MTKVAFLLFDGFQILDLTGPAAAFEIAGHFGADYSLIMVATAGERIRSSGGITVEVAPLDDARDCEVIFVPGANRAWEAAQDGELIEALRSAA
ncbi:MAG TPA: DJ-1/PfpI family protein, partial [Rhodocyclaceae bacterium]